ncbi:MAG TPA: Smr/MutS family protein [Terriglobia bacterium]|nr:Smr/MutS family protein [Terriglobia bacterium]
MTNSEPQAEIHDRFSREVLEFAGVIELLRGFLTGPIAYARVAALEPRTDLEQIRRELELVKEAREFMAESSRPSFSGIKDPRSTLEKLSIEGVALDPHEILGLVEVARAACDLRGLFVKSPFHRLDGLAGAMGDFRELVKHLDGKILPDGAVDSSASKELARIRRATDRLRGEVQSTLEKLVRQFSHDEVLQDAVVTLRNERFVIPVRTEEKRRVGGVIHGASSSGATVFVEPLETVPLNNELVELQDREFAEIQRILAEFSDMLRAQKPGLEGAAGILGELDLVFAKADFARAYDCCLPEFLSTPGLVLKDARHPLLEKSLRVQKRKPVPITIELCEPKILMIVSGPNTGGKTVALKTAGISILMAQAGLPVAASEAHLHIFQRVLADIGDQQSIQANLSTFSAHIANIQSMVQVADRSDLVLLDEIGASTEPNEGAALAVAILEHFRERGAVTLVTTHHSRLKAYAAETPQALNASMEFDEVTLEPTYRLISGLPGKSSGIDTAERLGLDPNIVQRARNLLDPADAEASALVATLHDQKTELENQMAALALQRAEFEAHRVEVEQKFEQERRKKLRELDGRLEETLKQYTQKWEKELAHIRAEVVAQSKAVSLGKKIERKAAVMSSETREEWNAQVLETLGAPASREDETTEAPPRVGDRVRVANLSSPGTIIALVGNDEVELEVGRLRMRVPKGEVQVITRTQKASPVSGHATAGGSAEANRRAANQAHADSGPPAAEINVIGTTADEARDLVDKFLDESFVGGRFRLRVVHGHGKGILMRALHEMFTSHPHVQKFYPAPPSEGGTGATIVELKM